MSLTAILNIQEYVEEKLFQKRSALQEKLARSSSPKEVKKMELLEFDRFLLHEMDKLRITQQEAFERVCELNGMLFSTPLTPLLQAGLPMFRVTRDLLEIERQKRTLSLLISAVHQ